MYSLISKDNKLIRLTIVSIFSVLFILGCSGSSESQSSSEIDNVDDATTNIVAGDGTSNNASNDINVATTDSSQVTTTEDTSTTTITVESEPTTVAPDTELSNPATPETAAPVSTRVNFDITVPAFQSNALQVRLLWGDQNILARFVIDESWEAIAEFPTDTENTLLVAFNDDNGGITLGSFEQSFRTGTNPTESFQITADQFDTDRLDDDNDGVSNLDELIAGTNPFGDNLPQPVQANLELLPVKTFRMTWQSSTDAESYRVLENPDGISGFTDISGELEAATTSFDHIVTLYSRVNAMYVVQSCNDQGCVDSEPVIVSGTLDNAIGYFKASNTGHSDSFGFAVSLSSDDSTLAVGAPRESSAATGVNGDQTDDSAPHSGAVYLFFRDSGLWQQQAYIKASNAGQGDSFGSAIGLSADGNTLAVGAPAEDSGLIDAGAVYTFVRSSNVWQEQAFIQASNRGFRDGFGSFVSLSADGNTLAVGTPSEDSTATGVNGNQGSDLANSTGAAYVFVHASGLWQQQAYIKASNSQHSDRFGSAISLNANGDTLAVGAPAEDSASTGINGDQSDNSASDSGALYVFVRSDGLWQQQAYIKASNSQHSDRFGSAISLNANGDTLAVGAPAEDSASTGINGDQSDNSASDSGALYVFVRSDGLWQQQAYIKASNTEPTDVFGSDFNLSAGGRILAVGAIGEGSASTGINGDQNDNVESSASGAVYLFVRYGGLWQQQAYIKASNAGIGDNFGSAVSLSADASTLAVGAHWEDSAATGINGDQNDNSADQRAGAVYLY